MKIKKILAVLMAFSMMTGIFTACGKQSENDVPEVLGDLPDIQDEDNTSESAANDDLDTENEEIEHNPSEESVDDPQNDISVSEEELNNIKEVLTFGNSSSLPLEDQVYHTDLGIMYLLCKGEYKTDDELIQMIRDYEIPEDTDMDDDDEDDDENTEENSLDDVNSPEFKQQFRESFIDEVFTSIKTQSNEDIQKETDEDGNAVLYGTMTYTDPEGNEVEEKFPVSYKVEISKAQHLDPQSDEGKEYLDAYWNNQEMLDLLGTEISVTDKIKIEDMYVVSYTTSGGFGSGTIEDSIMICIDGHWKNPVYLQSLEIMLGFMQMAMSFSNSNAIDNDLDDVSMLDEEYYVTTVPVTDETLE